MYRALLYQILHKIPRLRPLLCKKRTLSAQSQDWSLSLLRSVFQDVIENLASEDLISYVDALDECTKDDVKEMVTSSQKRAKHPMHSTTTQRQSFTTQVLQTV